MSEYGKGYAYNLGLFLAHEGRVIELKRIMPGYNGAGLWFNGAADHLFELTIPETLPLDKRKEIEAWQYKCLRFRLEECSWEDVTEACKKAKNYLRQWDEHNLIPSEEGDWE